MNSRLSIQTPEGVTFSFELATPAVRALAWSVDAALLGAASGVISQLTGGLQLLSADYAAAIGVASYFFASLAYGIVLEWRWRGQTIGKRVLGLRVIDADG